jgi:hypothetical protein
VLCGQPGQETVSCVQGTLASALCQASSEALETPGAQPLLESLACADLFSSFLKGWLTSGARHDRIGTYNPGSTIASRPLLESKLVPWGFMCCHKLVF